MIDISIISVSECYKVATYVSLALTFDSYAICFITFIGYFTLVWEVLPFGRGLIVAVLLGLKSFPRKRRIFLWST